MADYAPMTCTIYDCPEDQQEQVYLKLLANGLAPTNFDPEPEEELLLGEQYLDDDATLGTPDELAADLEEAGATFAIYQDAKYEFNGYCRLYAPDLGSFTGLCSNDEEVLVSASELDTLLAKGPHADLAAGDPGAIDLLEQAIRDLTAEAWRDRFAMFVEMSRSR